MYIINSHELLILRFYNSLCFFIILIINLMNIFYSANSNCFYTLFEYFILKINILIIILTRFVQSMTQVIRVVIICCLLTRLNNHLHVLLNIYLNVYSYQFKFKLIYKLNQTTFNTFFQ